MEEHTNGVYLELGDIIMVYAPTNPALHHNAFFIQYIDENKIKLINIADQNTVQLNLDENGQITDESITQIRLKSRSNEKGFARQYGLLPNKWVNIHFGGEYPRIDVGKITNLEEDMIEITIVPDNVIYYINFEYKGIPEYLPIEKIVLRSKPSFLGNKDIDELVKTLDHTEDTDETETEQKDGKPDPLAHIEGEQSPTVVEPEEFMPNLLTAMYLDADEIFEESLGEITQIVEVSEREKRHTLEMQITNIADKLLAKIPVSGRTGHVADRIQNIINKFKQLRATYSILDENNNVIQPIHIDTLHKPIVHKLKEFKERLRWIIPIITNKKVVFGGSGENDENSDMYTIIDADTNIAKDITIQEEFSNKKTGRGERELKYDKMIRDLYSNGTVYDIPALSGQVRNYVAEVECVEAIIEHLDDFLSYTVKEFTKLKDKSGEYSVEMKTEPFIISRFCGSATKIKTDTLRSGKKVQELQNITSPEKIYVKSLLVMPEQVVNYSRVDLHQTSILTRAELAMTEMHLHRVLRNSKDCENVVVYDLEKHIDFENEDAPQLLKKMQRFIVGDEIAISTKEEFEDFLNVIFPNIRTIVRLLEKYMTGAFSFIHVLEHLEPFAIYANNVSFKQYTEIRHFLKEKIKKYKTELHDKTKEYHYYTNGDLKIKQLVNNIAGLFADKTTYNEWFKNAYNLDLTKNTNGELIHSMYTLDYGRFFSKLIVHRMLELFTPNNIVDIIKNGAKDDDDDDTDKKAGKCTARKVIAKRYDTIASLQKDNGKEDLLFDKVLDDTPYSLLDLYKSKQKEMTEPKFLEYFKIVLIDKHGCPENIAHDLAKTILAGKKVVKNGDYAIVQIKNHDDDKDDNNDKNKKENSEKTDIVKTAYFKRAGNSWVRDTDIEEEAFMDSNKLLCNLSNPNCVSIGKTIESCADEKQAIAYFQNMLKHRVLDEFDKKMELSIDELKTALERELTFLREQAERHKKLKYAELFHANNLMYRIGQTEKAREPTEIIQSPHISLRDAILSQTDFIKKQTDITKFCAMYCRTALTDKDEIEHWLYCKETNTKLFPRSLFKLAEAFLVDGDEYNKTMFQLYKEVGTLSEDKDCIIDKYTNYKLNNIETREEEDFDEHGFRIVSHSELAPDEIEETIAGLVSIDEGVNLTQQQEKRVFETETAQTVYNICTKLIKDMGVPNDVRRAIEDTAIAFAMPMVNSKIASENAYERKRTEAEKNTGKKSAMPPYTTFCDKMYIYLSACAVILAIQTSTPSVKITKTFSGCVRILDGYPLGGMENMGTIKYMACILLKVIAKVRPWNALEQVKTVESMTANILKTMNDIYLKSNEIEELLLRKREYLATTPENIIPENIAVEKWTRFMPPLVAFSVEKTLQNVSTNFKKELENMIKTGHRDQDIYLNVLKSKLLAHTYGIVEQINNVVKTKNMLLLTRSNIPFTENACCNEKHTLTALDYFKEEDGNIEQFTRRCANIQNILNSVKILSKPAILYHPLATNIRYKQVPDEIHIDVVYATIIHYCKLDKNIPIPPQFHGIMADKIAGYDATWTLPEKRAFLERHGRRFNITHLATLMNIVNRENAVSGIVFKEEPVLQINAMRNFLKEMDNLDKTRIENNTIDAKLRHLLSNVIDEYKPTIVVNQMRTSEILLRKHLMRMNTDMIQGIADFIKENATTIDAQNADVLIDYIANIDKWQLDDTADSATNNLNEHTIFTILQYLKTSIYSLTKMYPNKIINNNVNSFAVLKHWKLSGTNKTDLEELFSSTFKGFKKYVGHPVAVQMLTKAETYFTNLFMFIETMPTIASIYIETDTEKKEKNEYFALMTKSTLLLLFKYCWLSVWHTYTIAFNSRELGELDRKMREYNRFGSSGEKEEIYDVGRDIEDNLNIAIMRGVQKDANQVMASILVEFMRVELKNKALFNLSYTAFEKKIYKTKEDEKKEITDYLGNMDDEERAVENMLKKFKLGRWGVGLDKGLFKYDKERYDKEREVMKMRLRDELAGNEFSQLFAETIAEGGIGETYDADELARMEMEEYADEYDLEMGEINIEEEFGGDFEDDDYDI